MISTVRCYLICLCAEVFILKCCTVYIIGEKENAKPRGKIQLWRHWEHSLGPNLLREMGQDGALTGVCLVAGRAGKDWVLAVIILYEWMSTECSFRGSTLTWGNTSPVFAFQAVLLFVPRCNRTFMFSLFKPSVLSKAQGLTCLI